MSRGPLVLVMEAAQDGSALHSAKSRTADADRSCILKVAGPAALLVSKVHKIGERPEDPAVRRRDRLAKDAFGIYRLLRAIDTADMASEFNLLGSHQVSGGVTSEALSMFQRLFSTASGIGTELVVRAVLGLEDPDFIAESSVALNGTCWRRCRGNSLRCLVRGGVTGFPIHTKSCATRGP